MNTMIKMVTILGLMAIAVIHSKKVGNAIAAAVWGMIALTVGHMMIQTNRYVEGIYLLASCFGVVLNIHQATLKINIYEYAIEFKSLLRTNIVYLNEIDYIESYNIVNSFNKGKAFGYRLIKDTQMLFQFDGRQYKNISSIEDVFSLHNYRVERIER